MYNRDSSVGVTQQKQKPVLTGDGASRAAFAGGDHDQHLHDIVVDLVAAALDNEDVLVAYGGFLLPCQPASHMPPSERHTDLDRRLAIAKLLQLDLRALLAEAFADCVDQIGVRGPGEDARLPHDDAAGAVACARSEGSASVSGTRKE